MRHRGYLTAHERQERSKLARLVHREPLLQGSLVDSTFKCGKDNCWCQKSSIGHPACYFSTRVGLKRKMIYVPKAQEKQARLWVKNYKEIIKSITKVSHCCLNRFKEG